MARFEFLGDLDRKHLIRARSRAMGSPNLYRPTYLSAVLVSEADPRHGAARAGLIDWSVPTPGFEAVEATLADLKEKLDGAVTDADLSDVVRISAETDQPFRSNPISRFGVFDHPAEGGRRAVT